MANYFAAEQAGVTCNSENVKTVVEAICETHSYEEPVIGVYKLTGISSF